LAALRERVLGRALLRVHIMSPFVLRSVDPPIETAEGRTVVGLRRLGKRVVFDLEGRYFLVVHLMISGRFRWQQRIPLLGSTSRPISRSKLGLAFFQFDSGTLFLTEASTKKRASIHLLEGEQNLANHHRGGLEVLEAGESQFAAAVRRDNRTLKRTLTDPRIISGVGNAYSDEILHAAGLSPFLLTQRLSDEQVARLFAATRSTLETWTRRLCEQFKNKFPGAGDITAFREGFAVHGRFGKPCPVCGTKVQRIRYADNETDYCPGCQTDGRILADRSLSRLLKDDWPRTIEEIERQWD
jgi:formamidopyrimidine-DNA glycosylase